MLRGAGLLDGRTNSTEEKLGSTREFSGYNCSLPLYTDLGLPVSKGPPGVSPEKFTKIGTHAMYSTIDQFYARA